eukprot:6239859-Amphidinium_carterae.1
MNPPFTNFVSVPNKRKQVENGKQTKKLTETKQGTHLQTGMKDCGQCALLRLRHFQHTHRHCTARLASTCNLVTQLRRSA